MTDGKSSWKYIREEREEARCFNFVTTRSAIPGKPAQILLTACQREQLNERWSRETRPTGVSQKLSIITRTSPVPIPVRRKVSHGF